MNNLTFCVAWRTIANLPAGSESYSDAGLPAETTYFYQVLAYNDYGDSGYTDSASATTDVAPALELSATGNKVKGKHSIDLVWSNTPSNMDVLESGSLVAENVAGTTFTHNTGNKRSATYFYQVCETGGTVVCSNEVMVVY